MAGPYVRVLPRSEWLHLPGPRERPRVPDRSRLSIDHPCAGERRHARVYGLQELLGQRWHASQERDRPGIASG